MPIKAYGPYQQSNGTWRVVLSEGGRSAPRQDRVFPTPEAANAFVESHRASQGLITVQTAVTAWERHLLATGTRPSTITVYRDRLIGRKHGGGILRPVVQRELKALTPARCEKLYDEYCEGRAPDTHRGALSTVKALFTWCRKKARYISTNPWDDVEPVGKKNSRKNQHRTDEARKLYRYLVARAASDDGALGALIALLLGFRAHEVVGITARDLDDGGTVLWAAGSGHGKTAGATAPVELPEELRRPLAIRANGRPSTARLLPFRPPWVRAQVQRACLAAGVPVVCAQALRGMHGTFALEAGVSAHAVAKTLRHTPKVLKRSYAVPGAGRSAAVETVSKRLRPSQNNPLSVLREGVPPVDNDC